MQAVHRDLRTLGEQDRQYVGGGEQRILDQRGVCGGWAAEHVIEHLRAIARMPDADSQSPERIAHVRDHVAHAVVPGSAAASFEAHDAGGEIELVVGDEDCLQRHLIEGRNTADRIAAVVHVAHRFEQPDFSLGDARTGELGAMPRLAAERRAVASRQLIHEVKAGVVTRARVFGAGVAEPDDQLDRLTCHVVLLPAETPPAAFGYSRSGRRTVHLANAAGYFLPPFSLGAALPPPASFFSSPLRASPPAAPAAGAAPGAPGAAPAAGAAPGAPGAAGAAPSAGTAAAASAATGSGSSARGAWIDTTGSLRRVSSGIVTPSGSGTSLRNLVSLRFISERSSSRNSGRSFGRQLTS